MKTVVITGVSRGLGSFTAKEFLGNGWRVIGTGRSPRPNELDAAIEYHQFDGSDAAACETFWQKLQLEEVCLVNNAGGYVGGKLAETDPKDIEAQILTNYLIAAYMTRALIRHIPKARIISVISNAAQVVGSSDAVYSASKAAEKHFFQTLQKELSSTQFEITNLYPTFINSDGNNPRAIQPEDLAALIAELASNHRSYTPTDITLAAILRN